MEFKDYMYVALIALLFGTIGFFIGAELYRQYLAIIYDACGQPNVICHVPFFDGFTLLD